MEGGGAFAEFGVGLVEEGLFGLELGFERRFSFGEKGGYCFGGGLVYMYTTMKEAS